MDSRIQVITVTDKPDHPGCVRLKKSADYWGWPLKVVKQDGFERWFYRAEQEGLAKGLELASYKYVMYVDAWDTMFVGPPQELPLREDRVDFCGDFQCFPDETTAKLFPAVLRGEFPYLNAGVIWGDARKLLEMTLDYLELGKCNNQTYFASRYLFERMVGLADLHIDHSARVALNLWGMDPRYEDLGRKNGRLWYKPTDTTPLVLHAAGSSCFHELPPMPPQAVERG